ncbi:B-cell receptor CD22-like [Phyllobates terribilis]|uniref:B-cell receptor CD22-like n=1 Tax=Phyllobates terribilis TaxID=111132 RepID=UPI003CCAFEB6
MKKICLLLICHGFYLGSVCQRWTFPSKITALIGSYVEIPCTYHPARSSGASSPVWYLSIDGPDQEILNTKNSSSVRIDYKDRTSLVPGDNSCTLRIAPVRREDDGKYYYPAIREDSTIKAADSEGRYVLLSITDKENIQFYVSKGMTEGETTTIRCSASHTSRSSPPSLQWNKLGQVHYRSVEISEGSSREESTLMYIPSYVDDGTPVRCTATYPNGQSFGELGTLNINYAPKNVTVIVLGMGEVMEGTDVTLQCNSFSKPTVNKYEWYKGKNKTKLPEKGREIILRNVTRDMEPYSCTAINHVGRGESVLTEISVLYAATEVHITVKNKNEFTELICEFLSSRPDVTHYTWMKDGSILQNETGKTLIINNNVENSGKYSCITHNNAGDSSSDIYHKSSNNSSTNSYGLIIIPAAIVTICLALLLFIHWRKKHKKLETTENEATYTDLMRTDFTDTYYQLNVIMPVIPVNSTPIGSDVETNNEYENVQNQNDYHQ